MSVKYAVETVKKKIKHAADQFKLIKTKKASTG